LISERKVFEKLELLEMLNNVSSHITEEIHGYLIGGLAMIFHGAKATTKDIDIIFKDENNAGIFIKALIECGFYHIKTIPEEYISLNTHTIMVNKRDHQFDIFILQVCNKLILSDTMISRSKIQYQNGKFTLHSLSLEDIFLFKGITDREYDLVDMYTIKGAGIDEKVVENELKSQPQSWRWIPSYYHSLLILKEEYRTDSISLKTLQNDAEIDTAICAIMTIVDNRPIPVDEIYSILHDQDRKIIKDVIEQMKLLNLINIKNNIIIKK